MPFDLNKLAQTTAYEHNCALNCLVHKIYSAYGLDKEDKDGASGSLNFATFMKNLFGQNVFLRAEHHSEIKNFYDLLNAFRTHYGLSVEKFELRDLVQVLRDTTNPAQREILLGPVLRRMLTPNDVQANMAKPFVFLGPDGISKLANDFGINVEAYANNKLDVDIMGGLGKLNARQRTTLKIKHNDRGHWEYEESTEDAARAHNQYYSCINQVAVAQAFRKTFKKGEWRNIKQVLAPLNSKGIKSANQSTESDSSMSLIEKGLGAIFGSFDKNDSAIQGLRGFFGLIFKLFFGIASIGKQIGKTLDPGAELDEEDFKKHPERDGPNFQYRVSKITQDNPALAKLLNRTWRNDYRDALFMLGEEETNFKNAQKAAAQAAEEAKLEAKKEREEDRAEKKEAREAEQAERARAKEAAERAQQSGHQFYPGFSARQHNERADARAQQSGHQSYPDFSARQHNAQGRNFSSPASSVQMVDEDGNNISPSPFN